MTETNVREIKHDRNKWFVYSALSDAKVHDPHRMWHTALTPDLHWEVWHIVERCVIPSRTDITFKLFDPHNV